MQCQSDSKKVWICKQLYTFYKALQKRDGEKKQTFQPLL